MQPGRETVFLRKRKGFIRIAMQAGAPVVPCFAFGQSQTFVGLTAGPAPGLAPLLLSLCARCS